MATTSPARIDDDLYASAKLAGEVQSRSASQQVVHWARIGREIEASAGISLKDIAEVLAGSRSYDVLTEKEQAFVRAEWSAQMDNLRESLNFAKEFAATGRTWVELDDEGTVVERGTVTGEGGGRAAPPAPTSGGTTARRDRKGVAGDRAAKVAAKNGKGTGVNKAETPRRRAGARSAG
jgi:hypothetical protein